MKVARCMTAVVLIALFAGCRGSGRGQTDLQLDLPEYHFERNGEQWADEEAALEHPLQVTYTRSGGFSGRHEVLTVHDDGRLEFTLRDVERREHRVDPERLVRLRRIVAGPGFEALESPDAPGGSPYTAPGRDHITYIIQVKTAEGWREVRASDGARWPPALRHAIRELDGLRRTAITSGERLGAESDR